MNDKLRPHERWIWTELIGFDNRLPDRGVAEYLETTGFVPDAICLLITSPDFILSHENHEGEVELPPDFCSRDGHEHNRLRSRQVWTNHQLRNLIAGLHEAGVSVYLTVFTRFYGDRFHHEWVSDHREVCMVFRDLGWSSAINCLSRLTDGSYFEDYWIRKLGEVLEYYGFDGWHGADGYGPLSGPIYRVSVADDMVDQFAEHSGVELPEAVTQRCDDAPEKLELRAEWIWRHVRHEWIEFYADRWAGFWRKVVDALHAAGKKAVINSAWGRAPFESLYRYGVDYRRIADTGVDGIVVETVAAGLCMEPRAAASGERLHYDFLSMLMLIKASVPDTKLIFLHNVHDIVEEWDAIHHRPALLEREIYSLSNVFHTRPDGAPEPCAAGFLACLGDGLGTEEWSWLRERWELAFEGIPKRALGATLVWSDAALDNQKADFTARRSWTAHRLLFYLMSKGAPVQTTADVRSLGAVSGAILVLNPHLLPTDELDEVLAYRGGPIILVGPKQALPTRPDYSFEDLPFVGRVSQPGALHHLCCSVYGAAPEPVPPIEATGDTSDGLPEDVMGIQEPYGYWDHMLFRAVSEGFLDACAQTIARVAGAFTVTEHADAVCVMATEAEGGSLRIGIKSKTPLYVRPRIDLGRAIDQVTVLTAFPSMVVTPEGTSFTVTVPPEGITVVEAKMRE
jgi:hypothetical protein